MASRRGRFAQGPRKERGFTPLRAEVHGRALEIASEPPLKARARDGAYFPFGLIPINAFGINRRQVRVGLFRPSQKNSL